MWCDSILVKFLLSNIVVDAEAGVYNLHFKKRPRLELGIQVCERLIHLTNVVDESALAYQTVAILLLLVVNVHQMSIDLL